MELLRRQGVVATRVRKQTQLFAERGKVTAADIAIFSRQLATMMAAGIPLVQALEAAADEDGTGAGGQRTGAGLVEAAAPGA